MNLLKLAGLEFTVAIYLSFLEESYICNLRHLGNQYALRDINSILEGLTFQQASSGF